jgi:hypothetical protein
MPEASAHIAKAEHNEKFAVAVRGLSTEFLDWVVSAYFYAALHYLEAYLAANPMEKHPSSHGERQSYVANAFSRKSYASFSYLKDKSETARYDTRLFNEQDIDANLIPKFDSFKNEALSLLSSWM